MVHEHVTRILAHLDTIRSPEVREAYLFLTHHAASLPEYDCRPADKGVVRDFRYYYTATGEQPFALIVNQGSLLWYFRSPGLRHPQAEVETVARAFAEVRETKAGEITVRLSSLEDARLIVALVFGGERAVTS